ncbi:dihydrouridine synthase [Petrotoga sp. 9PW.55.5.1]|uniref:tRNA dihydrouridine synthase n=1 Tax=Petrotoga sp. 9PW.55.5.1 TaxID=1308979 RepID=UPI000DC57920|nr:tRNA-dihydrouridine synthase family protein [Petrotoga sp. 9PW.55.5.1]RAO99544.1 dihydrouridine synthase [Petrotoga sp. 9PW.55.5.1]
MKYKIGLAPMADYTDYPFRNLAREFGAQFTFTEMISVDSILRENEKVEKMLPQKNERNIGIQLFGNEPKKFVEAAKRVEHLASWIDINAACPANKVIKKGSGAALLKTPELLGKIIRNLKANINLPVGVKVRIGFDIINIEEVSKIIEENGADYIIVHGRTKTQLYSGKADRSFIKKLKENINVPLGASGDVFCREDIEDYINNYGADFVLVARGAIGNPWIFMNNNYIPSKKERIEVCLKHLALMIDFYKSENFAVKKFRKVLIKYFSGFEGAKEIRKRMHTLNTFKDVSNLIENVLK